MLFNKPNIYVFPISHLEREREREDDFYTLLNELDLVLPFCLNIVRNLERLIDM